MLQAMGHAGLAALLAPGLSLVRSDHAKAAREPLIQPSEIRSQNGVLDATITAAPGRLQLGETELPGFFYNGSYLAPLLRVRLGDVIRIRFKNELLDGFSNLHYHGMNVSPRGRSDNVFIHVLPGHEFKTSGTSLPCGAGTTITRRGTPATFAGTAFIRTEEG